MKNNCVQELMRMVKMEAQRYEVPIYLALVIVFAYENFDKLYQILFANKTF